MRIHQLVARLDPGDAISNQALSMHELFRSWGFESHLYAFDMDDYGKRFAEFDNRYRRFMHERDDLLIYHFGIYCDNHRYFLESANRKVLIYHNITPPEFYDPYYPEAVRLCRMGRELMPRLKECDLALGDSDYNRRELVEAGFPEERTGVLPINPPLNKLDEVEEDRALLRRLQDGRTNLLFVGRVVPNKRVEDVVKLFACYHYGVNARSRLVIAGMHLATYQTALLSLTERLGLLDKVHFLGKVSDSSLKACYLGAHYYLSMSEHEGFCVPLLEAFHFGIPVLAYAAGAVPETMGGAGVLFEEKDYPLLAELLGRLDRDDLMRERIVSAQYRRLEDFRPEAFAARLRAVVDRFASPAGGEKAQAAADGREPA
ncbi:glycosyltransferase [Candidatus Solincola tengchongensis]|uniref:glycosyltransferase n=1 Tax=Candidatus Solincola tengchongensis TaxID=2900693 RepID=UPI00257A2BEA|nr:glycosyltransferase [Candidatus Solincola tengchongensis]